jgi:NAD(P)-dependent dehydrogenase (short-subunit alcohol dehydrogenase family)
MSLYALLAGQGPSGFGYGSTAEQVTEGLDLSGRHILITGCNSGLGLEAMRVLTLRGATVVGTARTQAKAEAACAGVDGSTIPLACELSEPASVRACVEAVKERGLTLDAIIANAGIMALPENQQLEGWERQLFVNHLGHFILVTGLLDSLAEDGRVVMLSSTAHKGAPKQGIEWDNLSGARGYTPWRSYGQSKLANLLFARELARRFEGTQRVATAVHPGVIATNLGRHMNPVMVAAMSLAKPLLLKTIPQGAATEVWAAVHPDAASINGEYLSDCNLARSSPQGQDLEAAARLWEISEAKVAELLGDAT